MDKYEVRNAAFFTRRSDCSIRSDNEIAGAMAPLKLNSLLSIVALQFTFASVTFIVRFKHHPPSRFQMAETNVRLPLASSLSPTTLISSYNISLGEGLSWNKWVSFASVSNGTAIVQIRAVPSNTGLCLQTVIYWLGGGQE